MEEHTYYVKLANIVNIPEELKGTKVIHASPKDLLEKVKTYYRFKPNLIHNVQLWSGNQYNSIRLDTLKEIPAENEFIWVHVVINNNNESTE